MQSYEIPVGPLHVSLEEPMYFRITVEGETVTGLEVTAGHVHRGIEYLTTKRNIYQNLALTERVCSLCSNSHPQTYCMALEEIAGIEVPERALYLRAIADEIKRIASHMFNVAINIGKGCHLDAAMIAGAVGELDPVRGSILFIENVGNLVCPAAFDLGEAARVVVLSVTEGDDKPLKYPDMFAHADVMILNKIDLLPYVRFDVARCLAMARRVNPGLACLQLSATTGAGLDGWLDWIAALRTGSDRPAGV